MISLPTCLATISLHFSEPCIIVWSQIYWWCIQGDGSAVWLMLSRHLISNTLHWRHNDHDGVSNHQPHGCLLNRLFRRRSRKTSKLRVTGLCVGNSPGPVNSPHRGPVTRKTFPFDDVIMTNHIYHRVRIAVSTHANEMLRNVSGGACQV